MVFFSALHIPTNELKVNSKPMLEFHNILTRFLFVVDKKRPEGHDGPAQHVPIRPQIMLDFLKNPQTRPNLDMKTSELNLLGRKLRLCFDALDKLTIFDILC
jgi:hypothetical protein